MGLKNWIAGAAKQVRARMRRFADDARGNVALITGLAMPILILMTMGGIDIHRIATVRVSLQDALDAAALAAARSPYVTDDQLKEIGWSSLSANLAAYPDITATEEGATFTLVGNTVVADANINVKTIAAHIFMPPYGWYFDETMPVSAHSEVDRSSRDVEVALVLDVTGSMLGSRISDLKDSAKELVDLVVQPVQTPYYSKVALIPYSMGVNLDSRAAAARGSVKTSVDITDAVLDLSGTAKTITSASRTEPIVIQSTAHGFANNDVVWIYGATGMTALNNKAYRVYRISADKFALYTLNGNEVDGTRNSYKDYTGSGKVRKCQNNNCSITITAANHGLSNNDYVYISDVNGMTQINGRSYLVGNVQTNTFTIDPDLSTITPYTSGGRAWCAQAGCTWFAFENMQGDLTTHRISTCVTERTGSNRYTDVAPSTARVGRNYPDTSNPCLSNTIVPLTNNAQALKTSIDAFKAEGSTAGQIGMAWGWYAISPNFNSLWPSGAAANYNTSETLKAVVIMTDGEFNTPYCQGVISRDAGSGSGANAGKIDCAPDNGDPFAQGKALCDGMRAQRVVVYTVGFQIAEGGNAADVLAYCASSPGNFFLPANGGDLSEAFAAIGRDITKLRIIR